MASPSNTQPEAETLHLQNPSPTHEESNQQQQPSPPPPNSQPQSPQFQTLETADPQIPQQSDPSDPQHQQEQDEENREDPQILDQEDQENQEQSGKSLSPHPMAIHVTISDPTPPPLTSPTNPNRRFNNKRKKGARNIKKQQAIEKKIQTLTENFYPIPFVPSKILDFPKHEKLLKHLGLWDFVHIEFDRDIRIDLIAQLIATYDSSKRCSYVNGIRIGVNRADLARALKLSVKKDKGNTALEGVDLDTEALSEESISFIEDFVSNWVLLHEDTWMMPSEVLNWTRSIKDGHPEKVDWASLFWFMVEKELAQGEKMTDCYYASHLQYLIKFQKGEMVMEEPKVEMKVEVKEEEDGGDGDLKMGDLKMGDANEPKDQENIILDEPSIELTLGQENGQDNVEKTEVKEDEMMNIDESKEEEHGQWFCDGKNEMGQHFLQPCQFEEAGDLDSIEEERKQGDEIGVEEEEEQEEEEEEEEEMEDGFNIEPNENVHDGDGLTGNLLQGMEENHIPYGLQRQLHDQFSSELLSSRAETHTVLGGQSIFGNNGKREMVHDHQHDVSKHTIVGTNKRMRTDGLWDNEPSDFGTCMEQVQQWAEKARIMYETKEQTYQEANMNQQILLNELQQRGTMIEHMHKSKCEELQKKDGEIFRLERELYLMGNLLEGYRKALKDTNKAFFEYRQRFQLPEEPVYKDAGPGGLVLGPVELEKQRFKQEEEDRLNRLMIEQKCKEMEEECVGKFQVHLNKVQVMDDRLLGFENEVKLLKELFVKQKVPEMSECAPDQNLACDVTTES
ncbi:hypothetical protein LguiA_035114 [Lonicera macranthoides]